MFYGLEKVPGVWQNLPVREPGTLNLAFGVANNKSQEAANWHPF